MQEISIGNFTIRKTGECRDSHSSPISSEFDFFFVDSEGKRGDMGLINEVHLIFRGIEPVRVEVSCVPVGTSSDGSGDAPLRKSDLDAVIRELGETATKTLGSIASDNPGVGYSASGLDNPTGT